MSAENAIPRSPAPRARAERRPALHDQLIESSRAGRQEEVRRCKAFAEIDAVSHYTFHGCASVGEYGVRVGFSAKEARDYAAAGRLVLRCPEAEAMLLAGQIHIATLAVIEPLFLDSALRPLDEADKPLSDVALLEWARVRPERELRLEVMRRKEEQRTGEATAQRTLFLTSGGAKDLDRTRILVARQVDRAVSRSEAAARAFRFFVERHDLMERASGPRRTEPMPQREDGTRNQRGVPAEVRRQLMRQHRDICAIEGCTNEIWLENAHHWPHALGGGNELEDMHRLCSVHHRMKDHGEILWVPASSGGTQGHYRTLEGEILGLRPPDRVNEHAPPYVAVACKPGVRSRCRRPFIARNRVVYSKRVIGEGRRRSRQ